MIIENSAKTFTAPDTGTFLATVVDVVDLGKVHTNFGDKVKIRIVWVLNANDEEGLPYRVILQCNASVNEKARLYEVAKGILGAPPPVPFDSETLVGRANQLVVVRETDPKTGRTFANVKVILPLPAGATPPPIPQGFVRAKDRPAFGQVLQSAAPQVATQAPPAQSGKTVDVEF